MPACEHPVPPRPTSRSAALRSAPSSASGSSSTPGIRRATPSPCVLCLAPGRSSSHPSPFCGLSDASSALPDGMRGPAAPARCSERSWPQSTTRPMKIRPPRSWTRPRTATTCRRRRSAGTLPPESGHAADFTKMFSVRSTQGYQVSFKPPPLPPNPPSLRTHTPHRDIGILLCSSIGPH